MNLFKTPFLAAVTLSFGLLGPVSLPLHAEGTSGWIWTRKAPLKDEKAFLRADLKLDTVPAKASVRWTCDNYAELVINGKNLGANPDWNAPKSASLEGVLHTGDNWLAASVANKGSGSAGFVLEILDESATPPKVIFSTGSDWRWQEQVPTDWQSQPFSLEKLQAVTKIGDYGVSPWGKVFEPGGVKKGRAKGDAAKAKPQAKPKADAKPEEVTPIQAVAGFQVDLVYTVPGKEQGSWVSLTVDDQGRFLAGDQTGDVFRLTLGKAGAAPLCEPLNLKVGHAQGLLFANKALYVVVNGSGSGLYKCTDADGDGKFESETLLKSFDGAGEHGPHQVVLGPDGQSLYVAGGNHTKLPQVESTVGPKLWQEDLLLPRMWDANGHAVNIFAPGGWFCKTDLEGKEWTVFSTGYRNQYDLAFNAEGEGFTYDSDMEWDIGMPWYRPTRINHVTPGSEHGWRSGSGVWPAYYLDSCAPVVNIGPGSPTGCVFGTGAKFPEKYQRALFASDWTYGTLYAVHLTPDGAGFTGEKEAFITGRPFPIADVVVHPDGAMYVLVGGRKTQSAVYRVTYTGQESTAPAAPKPLNRYVKQRKDLEALLTAPASPEVVTKALQFIGNKDRLIRFTARSVLEKQPLASWQEKAFDEKAAPSSIIDAMACLCRVGDKSLQPRILSVLRSVHDQGLRESEMTDLVRVYSLCFTRMGKPEDATVLQRLREQFEPMFPTPSETMNKEVAEMLVFLDSKQIVSKLVQYMQSATATTEDPALNSEQLKLNSRYAKAFEAARLSQPNHQQIRSAFALQYAKEGWTPELRRSYFRWFNTALQWQGGHSFKGFLEKMRSKALENCPAEMKAELTGIAGQFLAAPKELPLPKGPGKPYDQEMLEKLATPAKLAGRDLAHGKVMFQAALCSSCHQFGNEFGGVGPDLTGVGARFSVRDLLENIILPSKVISDQYGSTLIEKNDSSSVVGRLISETETSVKIAENPLLAETLTEIQKADIKTRNPYPISAMPPALLNNLNEDEVLDLLAFLLGGVK